MTKGAALFLVALGIASAQTSAPTLDGYLSTAKAAAGTDWAGTFLRLCIPPRMVKIPDVPESSGLVCPVIIRPGGRSAARNATLQR